MTLSKVFIGIPTIKTYQPFWESLNSFTEILKRQCDVEICIVRNKTLAVARNEIADRFLKSDSDYLLFLDDDHSGHTLQMFNALLDPIINNGSVMCGMKCYARNFPYTSNILVYSNVDEKQLGIQKDSGKYVPIDMDGGYRYVNLVGFGMTLLTRKAFEIVQQPYFVSDSRIGQGREDNYFCDKLVKAGVEPVGCFEYTLDHAGIGAHNGRILQQEGIAKIKEKYPDMKVLVS